jgi:predicted O-linked N-acetylglucosamine transferase (SPINDLY family)
MVPWLVDAWDACLHAVKRLRAQGRKRLTRARAHSRLRDDRRISRALPHRYWGLHH